VSGYLVPSGDPSALAERLEEVLANEDRRRRMGQRGRECVQRQFTFAGQCDRYLELFAQLTGQPGVMKRDRAGTDKVGVPAA
jgi:glycosyltransferase involved in cell wall biosynthesis